MKWLDMKYKVPKITVSFFIFLFGASEMYKRQKMYEKKKRCNSCQNGIHVSIKHDKSEMILPELTLSAKKAIFLSW